MADFGSNSYERIQAGSSSLAESYSDLSTFQVGWKYFRFLFPRALLVAGILGVILAPFLVLGNYQSSAFVQVYYYPVSNHTVIIHGIRLSKADEISGGVGFDEKDYLQGISKYFVSTTTKKEEAETDEKVIKNMVGHPFSDLNILT